VWVAGDFERGCAGLEGRKTYCWGASLQGELGAPPFDASIGTVFAAFENPVSRVVFGGAFSCAIVDGAPVCRGGNASGELGRGVHDRDKHVELGKVMNLDKVTAIAAGGAHACAVLADRSVACWGLGDQGQIGNATIGEASVPAIVVAPK
jgi:alpha-tubulin suppressor-like RCC1 family protein